MTDITLDFSRPIVWTTHGNLNEDTCEVFIEWQKNENEIVFVKHWHYQGAQVKREAHVLKLKGSESVADNVPLIITQE